MKITFLIITALSLTALTPALLAQDKAASSSEKKKVLFTKNGKANDNLDSPRPEIAVLVEYISVDLETSNELLVTFSPKATDAAELRDSLEKMIDKGKAELVETLWVRSRSAQRAKTESVREDYYPTQYDPPELPYVVATNPANPKAQMTHAVPGGFNTRNVGSTLEVDPVLSPDHKTIILSLSPEIVTRLKDHYFTRKDFENKAWGIENIFMPTFYTIKDTTQIEVAPGKYNLLGIHTPHDDKKKRILVLLRADLISFD